MGCQSSREGEGKETQALSVDDEFFKLHVDSGHMNERRRSFVRRLYVTLGDETTLEAEQMAAAFDADAHPDVVAGNRKATDVRNELTESLAAAGGPVTLQLFEDYYDLQSITIENDDQFEALVRSSWINLVRQNAKRRKHENRTASRAAA
mmetsp:Transcript_353/g.1078  ORF Transcript_353/g.1078 Transcript_353/m.1078 type:complete len:150 (-) Transcript_353:325-774(-)